MRSLHVVATRAICKRSEVSMFNKVLFLFAQLSQSIRFVKHHAEVYSLTYTRLIFIEGRWRQLSYVYRSISTIIALLRLISLTLRIKPGQIHYFAALLLYVYYLQQF